MFCGGGIGQNGGENRADAGRPAESESKAHQKSADDYRQRGRFFLLSVPPRLRKWTSRDIHCARPGPNSGMSASEELELGRSQSPSMPGCICAATPRATSTTASPMPRFQFNADEDADQLKSEQNEIAPAIGASSER